MYMLPIVSTSHSQTVIGNLNKTTQQTLTDYYKILNLTLEASESEIKKSFRKLATIYHPDKNGGSKKA